MLSALPSQLRQSRLTMGLTQAQLGSRLDVPQQTIARWEKGSATPSTRQIAQLEEVFAQPAGKWLAMMEKGNPIATDHKKSPARPLHGNLPLDSLTPREFERLTHRLAQAKFPEGTANLVGGSGHSQDGVDVIATNTIHGKIIFQCKRERRFGVAKICEVVKKAEQTNADVRILVLSQIASPAVRKKAKELSWKIWDHDDIVCILQHELDLVDAHKIVRVFFPGYRQHFLGLRDCGPWLTSEEYFDSRLKEKNGIFSHGWQFVGREKQLAEVLGWMSGDQLFCALTGPAGIGKTRLLLEIFQSVEKDPNLRTILFVDPTSDVQREDFHHLGSGSALLIIDDAHDRDDLEVILRGALERQSRAITHVLLATRPYGKSLLLQDFAKTTGDFTSPVISLEPLSKSNALTLAAEVLGMERSASLVRSLVAATGDCTLFLVAAGVLLRAGQIDTTHLGNFEGFRTLVLEKMYDDYVRNTGHLPSALVAQDVLQLLAATQPFNLHDLKSLESAAEILGKISQETLLAALEQILATGVVVKRGSRLSIQPDLLADHILAEASFKRRLGVHTLFPEKVWSSSSSALRRNLIINLARVDWHLSATGVAPNSLLDTVWNHFESEFHCSGIYDRVELLKLLKEVAYYQPARALDLVRWALDNSFDCPEIVLGCTFDNQDVYSALTSTLQNCAYYLESLEEVCDLLWKLGEIVPSVPSNSNPGHPIRVLGDLASFSRYKPISFTKLILNCALGWFREKPTSGAIDILDNALSWEVRDSVLEGHTITMSTSSPLSLLQGKALQDLRRGVLKPLIEQLGTSDLGLALRIIRSLSNSMRGPIGLFGRVSLDEERQIHAAELEWILQELIASNHLSNLDPLVSSELQELIKQFLDDKSNTVSTCARKALGALPSNLDCDLSDALRHGIWGNYSGRSGQELSLEDRKQWIDKLVEELLESDQTTDNVIHRLEHRLNAIIEAGGQDSSPAYFFEALIQKSPEVGSAIAAHVLKDLTSPLRFSIGVVIATLRQNPDLRSKALELSLNFLQLDTEEIVWEIASALGTELNPGLKITRGELDLIRKLASDKRYSVAINIIRGLRQVARQDPESCIRLLLEMEIGRWPELTDRALNLFSENEPLNIGMLKGDTCQAFCDQLVLCNDIGGHWTGHFLGELSKLNMSAAIEILQRRVELLEAGKASKEFRPLPFRWGDESPISSVGDPRRKVLLDGLCNWASADAEGWARSSNSPSLFAAVAGEFDADVFSTIKEGLAAEMPKAKRVAHLLTNLPAAQIWSQSQWIVDVLESTSRIDRELYKALCSALHNAAISGVRHGTPGQPFPEDLEQRRLAQKMADSLVSGSAAERFYRGIQHSAEQSIRWADDEDWE